MSRYEQIEQRSISSGNLGEAETPRQELITQRDADKTGHGKEHAAHNPLTEQDQFYPAFWERFIEKASLSPSGEDPAFWPIKMLQYFRYLIS